MINITAIGEEAAKNIEQDNLESVKVVLLNAEITTKTLNLLTQDPAMALLMDGKSIATIQVLVGWYWEMGRLYGRQQMVDETLNGFGEE
jgi:hypothetical protein